MVNFPNGACAKVPQRAQNSAAPLLREPARPPGQDWISSLSPGRLPSAHLIHGNCSRIQDVNETSAWLLKEWQNHLLPYLIYAHLKKKEFMAQRCQLQRWECFVCHRCHKRWEAQRWSLLQAVKHVIHPLLLTTLAEDGEKGFLGDKGNWKRAEGSHGRCSG